MSVSTIRFLRTLVIVLALVMALSVGFVMPTLAAGSTPSTAPLTTLAQPFGDAQGAPIENSIFPALVQIVLIVLVTEGIKSLLKAFTNGQTALAGREAAIAYVVVGLVVYLTQTYLLPALPPDAANALTNVLQVLAVLLAGSGLFSMTSAFRIGK